MIRDAQNTFYKSKNVAAVDADAEYSDVIDGTAAGDAVNQMYLFFANTTALQDGTLTVTLQTATDEAFTSPVDLASYAVTKAKGAKIKDRLPIGVLQYLRLQIAATLDATKTSIGAGVVTAALVYDVEID